MLKALSLPFFNTSLSQHAKKPYVKAAVRPVLFWIGLALAVIDAVMLFSYLAGVNSKSLEGYEIKQVQNRIAALSEENKKLDLKISEASSVLAIQQDFSRSNYVSMGTPKFLEVESGQFTYTGTNRP